MRPKAAHTNPCEAASKKGQAPLPLMGYWQAQIELVSMPCRTW